MPAARASQTKATRWPPFKQVAGAEWISSASLRTGRLYGANFLPHSADIPQVAPEREEEDCCSRGRDNRLAFESDSSAGRPTSGSRTRFRHFQAAPMAPTRRTGLSAASCLFDLAPAAAPIDWRRRHRSGDPPEWAPPPTRANRWGPQRLESTCRALGLFARTHARPRRRRPEVDDGGGGGTSR